jgi:hypothetical protein
LKEIKTKSKSRKGPRSVVNLAYLPWNLWAQRGALVFADDLTIQSRTKLNNQGAHALGVKFNVCAEQVILMRDRDTGSPLTVLPACTGDGLQAPRPLPDAELRCLHARNEHQSEFARHATLPGEQPVHAGGPEPGDWVV